MTKYNVIYADPPWHYPNGLPYETMSFEEINNLPINHISKDDSVCFLWATTPYLPQALETLKAWGFEYKTTITWVKTYANAKGSYFKINTEHLLVGVKGNIPSFQMKESNIYLSEPTAHSQKPDYFRSLVSKTAKKVFASPLKLELFARDIQGVEHESIFKDWHVFGNQVENSISL
ncbi:MAG: MT-A70 family methyltransferase [Vicingaceae bacterium]